MQSIDYENGPEVVSEKAQAVLNQEHIVLVRNFPPSKDSLIAFCANFGSFLPPYGTRIENMEDMVGDVWVNADVEEQNRLLTEGNSELGPHTAHAWRVERPRYFGLLMIDPGWRDQDQGNNGESVFTHIDAVLSEMRKRYPDSFDKDFNLLRNTPVRLPISFMEDEIDNSPIIFDVDGQGLGLRYKGNTKELIEQSADQIPDGRTYYQALSRFYESAQNATERIEIPLDSGDFVLVDNRRVMHARRPFPFSRMGVAGQEINPRHLYNIHIL